MRFQCTCFWIQARPSDWTCDWDEWWPPFHDETCRKVTKPDHFTKLGKFGQNQIHLRTQMIYHSEFDFARICQVIWAFESFYFKLSEVIWVRSYLRFCTSAMVQRLIQDTAGISKFEIASWEPDIRKGLLVPRLVAKFRCAWPLSSCKVRLRQRTYCNHAGLFIMSVACCRCN